MSVRKNNFGFHSNQKTQGHKHQLNNLYFKHKVCQIKLRHLNTFLQFWLLFYEPHCMCITFPPWSCNLQKLTWISLDIVVVRWWIDGAAASENDIVTAYVFTWSQFVFAFWLSFRGLWLILGPRGPMKGLRRLNLGFVALWVMLWLRFLKEAWVASQVSRFRGLRGFL